MSAWDDVIKLTRWQHRAVGRGARLTGPGITYLRLVFVQSIILLYCFFVYLLFILILCLLLFLCHKC